MSTFEKIGRWLKHGGCRAGMGEDVALTIIQSGCGSQLDDSFAGHCPALGRWGELGHVMGHSDDFKQAPSQEGWQVAPAGRIGNAEELKPDLGVPLIERTVTQAAEHLSTTELLAVNALGDRPVERH